ncbi:hypothetical protein ACIGG5_33650 [Streptomyces sp. NPDC085463]|uniref:hypothetical protein n=1 Tax=Streptomyces sp. NPDC085463 TaxID=3365724 RepID=UPI0037CE0BFA
MTYPKQDRIDDDLTERPSPITDTRIDETAGMRDEDVSLPSRDSRRSASEPDGHRQSHRPAEGGTGTARTQPHGSIGDFRLVHKVAEHLRADQADEESTSRDGMVHRDGER